MIDVKKKNGRKKKILWILISIAIIFFLVGIFEVLFIIRVAGGLTSSWVYNGDLYIIKVNELTKKLQVKTVDRCTGGLLTDGEKCDYKVKKESINLTKDELRKLKKVYKKQGFSKFRVLAKTDNESDFIGALQFLVGDEKVLWNARRDGKYFPTDEDFNEDGKVTYRESGNFLLDDLLKKNN